MWGDLIGWGQHGYRQNKGGSESTGYAAGEQGGRIAKEILSARRQSVVGGSNYGEGVWEYRNIRTFPFLVPVPDPSPLAGWGLWIF